VRVLVAVDVSGARYYLQRDREDEADVVLYISGLPPARRQRRGRRPALLGIDRAVGRLAAHDGRAGQRARPRCRRCAGALPHARMRGGPRLLGRILRRECKPRLLRRIRRRAHS
jgi:hypothetical protein